MIPGDLSIFSLGWEKDQESYQPDLRDLFDTSDNNILEFSLQESGVKGVQSIMEVEQPSWDDDTDEFLKSMLTGSDLPGQDDLSAELGTELGTNATEYNFTGTALSDTSSDSGCHEDLQVRTLTSPGLDDGPRYSPAVSYSSLPSPSTVNGEYFSNAESENGDAVSPIDLVSITDPELATTTGTTTILLPVVQSHQHHHPTTVTVTPLHLAPRDIGPAAKRRRLSTSSSDSGMDDLVRQDNNKYPPLELNDEEHKMAIKEGMKFPSHYPLTREEERNLKKIRRKIRNKLSAQDSRKRKREYMDNMEDRVKQCTEENQQLQDKIKALETQNKTLAAQLRRLHQIVVNGGSRQGQTSTALMVLLLSTALFLIPGLRDQTETKSEIDLQTAVKMPPMPGQSRSLLQFDGHNNDIADMNDFSSEPMEEEIGAIITEAEDDNDIKVEIVGGDRVGKGSDPPYSDHDYTFAYIQESVKTESGSAWIEEDAPPLGYGSAVKEDEDRHMNVNVSSTGQGTKTVILQIPKDII